MKNTFSYKIIVQYPETEEIAEYTITSNEPIPIYNVPNVAVDKGILELEEIEFITSISEIDSKNILFQTEQIVLTPRESSGTSRQFSHLMKDLHINDDDYALVLDNGNVTKGEITICIYPSVIEGNPIHDMTQYNIKQIISILNLNPKKTVTVNYMLLDDLKKLNDEYNLSFSEYDNCEEKCCNDCDNEICCNHPEYPSDECCEDCCGEDCECENNPKLECCKECDIASSCGCYNNKISNTSNGVEESLDSPEKTIRIPVDPIHPKEEIVMLADAIAKRLAMIKGTDNKVIIKVEKDLDNNIIDSFVRTKFQHDEIYPLHHPY